MLSAKTLALRPENTAYEGRKPGPIFAMAASACRTMRPNERCEGFAVGRRNWTFCGSDSGGQRAAAIYVSGVLRPLR